MRTRFFAIALGAFLFSHALELRAEPAKQSTLGNGLTLLVQRQAGVPVVAIDIAYDIGTRDDPDFAPGFAYVASRLIERSSTRHVRAEDKFDIIRTFGLEPWDVKVAAWLDRTEISMVVPARAFELALWLESDRMGWVSDGIDAISLSDAVKSVEKEQSQTKPFELLSQRATQALFGAGHPYGHGVSLPTLRRLVPSDVRTLIRQRYGASRASIAITGDVDPVAAASLVKKYFGTLPRVTKPKPATLPAPASRTVTLSVPSDVESPTLYRAWRTPRYTHADDVVLDVAARWLLDRLSRRLTDNKGPASWVFVREASHDLGSTFIVAATAAPGHELAESGKVIDEELEVLRSGKLEAAEVARSRDLMLVGLVGGLDAIDERARWYNSMFFTRGDPGYFMTYRAAYQGVDAERLHDVAKRLLSVPPAVSATLVPGQPAPQPTPKAERTTPRALGKSPALADEAFRYQPPKVGKLERFTPPVPEALRLDNGVRALVLELPDSEKVRLRMVVRWDGALPCCGLPWMVGNLVRNARLPSGQTLKQAVSRFGSYVEVTNDLESTQLALRVMPDQLEDAARLLVEGWTAGQLDPELFEPLHKQAIKSFDEEDPDLRAEAWAAFALRKPGQWSFMRMPDRAESLKKLSLDEVKKFHARAKTTDAVRFAVVGRVDAAQAKQALERATKPLTRSKKSLMPPHETLLPGVFAIDDPSRKDTQVKAYMPIPDWSEGAPAAALGLLSFLQMTSPSKPNMADRLREAGVDRYQDARASWEARRSSLALTYSARVPPELAASVIRALLEQLASLQKGSFPSLGVADARRLLARWIVDRYYDPESELDELSHQLEFDEAADSDAMLYRHTLLMSHEDVTRAATKYLGSDRLSVVVVGPLTGSRAGLEKLGLPFTALDTRGKKLARP